MKCPQCMRENQFPVPGLCPDCYRQWKDDMRARYGPGPWPAQLAAQKAYSGAEHSVEHDVSKEAPALSGCSATMERSVTAIIQRLAEPNTDNSHLLVQVKAVLHEVTRILAQSAAV